MTVTAWLLGAAAAVAHPTLDDQLADIARQLDAGGDAAVLLLRRAELRQQRREWDKVLSDCAGAEHAGAPLEAVEVLRAQALLGAGHAGSARAALDRALARAPEQPALRLLRARAALALADPASAAADFEAATTAGRTPLPDDYLAWAHALVAAGRDDEAVRRLDQGVARLGPLPVLQLAAVDASARLGRHAEALRRLDVVLATQPRQPYLLVRRAQLLERAGRPGDARASYRDALSALESRPASRRQGGAAAALWRRIQTALAAPAPRMEERP